MKLTLAILSMFILSGCLATITIPTPIGPTTFSYDNGKAKLGIPPSDGKTIVLPLHGK